MSQIIGFVELAAPAPELLYQLEKTGRVITDETPGLSKKRYPEWYWASLEGFQKFGFWSDSVCEFWDFLPRHFPEYIP